MPVFDDNLMGYNNVITNQDFPYGYDLKGMNGQEMHSPFGGSQGTSDASPLSTLSFYSPEYLTNNDFTNNGLLIDKPYLRILEQPVEKFRFRYKSEMMGIHGCLTGSSSSGSRNKHAPTVKLHNYCSEAIIRCTLVTSNEGDNRIPHAHRLVRRVNGEDVDDPHDITVNEETGFVATFLGMGIIHTAKKHVREELIRKMRGAALEENQSKGIETLSARQDAQIKREADSYQKCVNLNSVALCFQAFTKDHRGVMMPLTNPVYSNAINNRKSALTGELKICRINKTISSVEGKEEIFLLVEKVGKKNIRVKFFELNEDGNEDWFAYGRFSELDVHHQYAIVFQTPPYKDLNITSPKQVYIQLERPSDGDLSEPLPFTYKPSERIIGRKRPRMSFESFEIFQGDISPISLNERGISEPLSIDSREISKELKKLLSENNSSPEVKDFIENLDCEAYIKQLDDDNLVLDGPSSKQKEDDVMFPKNILKEVMHYIKSDKESSKQIQQLLKHRSTFGDSPLHAALRYGQREIVKYILMLISTDNNFKMVVNEQNSSGKTPLHYAVLQNQPDIVRALLELDADPNLPDEYGCSPLHIATRSTHTADCVEALLLNKKTKIETHNDAGWTPLHLAAEAGSYKAVCLLVEAGINVNTTDMSYGRTALHIAVDGGHKEIVEYLLQKTNIDINKRNFSGNTALHTAVVHTGTRAKELCELLTKYGADPHIKNHNRETTDMEQKSVHIKEEVNSDNEAVDEYSGQSSFDLAMNKPDILQLLHRQNDESSRDMCSVLMKKEIEDEDSEEDWLNEEQKCELSAILDESQGWCALAKHLKFDRFLKVFPHNSPSPSLLLLNYIDVKASMSLDDLETALRNIGESKAANYVSEVLCEYK